MDREIAAGYKQTEVGVIPNDWKIKLFKDICWVNQGLQIAIENRLNIPSSHSKIYITIQYLNDRNDNKNVDHIDLYSQSVCCDVNDILMTRTGNTGIVVTDVSGVFHNNFFKINYDKKQVIKDYVVYYLKLRNTQKLILDKAGTSTIPDLNHNDFYSIPIVLPSTKTEQTAIATALSDIDALISGLDNTLAKKRLLKLGTMQELLTGKKRLAGFSGEWEVKKLGDIGECIIGLTYSPHNVKESGLLVLRSSNISNNKLKFDDNVFVDISVSDKLITKSGDILICVRNGSRRLIGKCALIEGKGENETFGAFMSLYRSEFSNFIFHVFQSNIIKKQIDEKMGATINQITNKDLNSFEIPFPPNVEQIAIAQILNDMDNEIESLEKRRTKTLAIKQGMMQELLTGKTRLT